MSNDAASGSAFPLGATVSGDGVNFAVYSKNAAKVDLLFFDSVDTAGPSRVISLDPQRHRTYHYWHASVPHVQAVQIYGYRAHGPFEPDRGLRFDAQKVLLDPYGRAIAVPWAYDRTAAAQGNNNAYCQDSEISWFDWSLVEKHAGLLRFVKLLLACRLDPAQDIVGRHETLTEFLESTCVHWHGVEVSQADWGSHSRSLAATARAPRLGPYLYWMVNAYWEPLQFKLPPVPRECQGPWRRWIDTALESPEDACDWRCGRPVTADQYRLEPRSLVILILPEINRVSTATA